MKTLYSERQIGLIRESGKIIAEFFAAMKEKVKPGITTKDIERIADEVIKKADGSPAFLGYKYGSHQPFPSSICASINNIIIHGIPDDKPLAEGDLVSIDIGVKKNFYYADSAWTFCAGTPDETGAKLLKAGEDALKAGIAAAKPKVQLVEVSRAIEDLVKESGFFVVKKFVGHGVGNELHEPPQVRNYVDDSADAKSLLKPGMVIAIEPMVNEKGEDIDSKGEEWPVWTKDGGRSVHFEHTVAILADRVEILTI